MAGNNTASFLDLLLGAQVQNNGTKLTPRRYLNFSTGFTVTDDPTNDRYTLTAAGGGLTPPVVLQAANAAQVPFTLQGAAVQTADLQRWIDSAGTILARIKSSGQLALPTTVGALVSDNSGNITSAANVTNGVLQSVGASAPSFTATPQLTRLGIGVAADANFQLKAVGLTTHSTAKFLGSGGGIAFTCLGADSNYVSFDADWTASAWIARATSACTIYKTIAKLFIDGSTGLTNGNSFSPTTRANMDLSNGNLRLGDGTTATAKLDVVGKADIVQLKVSSHSTQTSKLCEFYNTAGALAAYLTQDGQLGLNIAGADVTVGGYTADMVNLGAVYMGVVPGSTNYTLVSGAGLTLLNATSTVQLCLNNSGVMTVTASLIRLDIAAMQYAVGVTAPIINQADNVTNGATAQPLTLQAANATGTTATGGKLILKAGTGTTVGGNIELTIPAAAGSNHAKLSILEGSTEFAKFGVDATSAFFALGTNFATAGMVRLSNNSYISARNAANSGNLDLWKANASDQLQTGLLTVAGHVITTSGGVISSANDMVVKNKPADESVTSSTTLQNDDDLVFAILANEVWAVRYVLSTTFATSDGIKFAITLPTSATCMLTSQLYEHGATSFRVTNSTTAGASLSLQPGEAVTASIIIIDILVVNSSNAGNVQFQFAQNNSSGTATVVKQNSYLVAIRK